MAKKTLFLLSFLAFFSTTILLGQDSINIDDLCHEARILVVLKK